MKINSFLKWFLPVVILMTVGIKLMSFAADKETESLQGYELYQLAGKALGEGKIEEAYSLYVQSSYELQDQEHKAIALYQAATIGWLWRIADYKTLVELYMQSLRYKPGFEEASFDLEFLYWLKDKFPEPERSPLPSREEEPTNGDV